MENSWTGADLGVNVKGETRQICWVDFDNDGWLDLVCRVSGRAQYAVRNERQSFR